MIPTIHDISLALYITALWRKSERTRVVTEGTAEETAGTIPRGGSPYNGAESDSGCGASSPPPVDRRIEPLKNRKKRPGDTKRNSDAA